MYIADCQRYAYYFLFNLPLIALCAVATPIILQQTFYLVNTYV